MKKRLTQKQIINKYFRKTEEQEQRELCKWLKAYYPDVLFTVDLGGMSLTKAQRIVHNTRCKRGHPDLMLQEWYKDKFCGLAIEFKRTGEEILYKAGNRKGTLKNNDHLKEQFDYLEELRARYWLSGFVVGLEAAKVVVKNYLEAGPNSLEIINKIIYPKINIK